MKKSILKTGQSSFGVVARLRGLSEKADELRDRLKDLSSLTRDEHGCISCELIENSCDATEFTLLQEWSDEKAHNAHFGSQLIQNAVRFLPHLLSDELDLHRHVLRLNAIRYGTNSYGLSMS